MFVDGGLILEGGGMRGLYTAGVLDFLMDRELWVKHVYGVSAGACHGTSYVAKQRGRAVKAALDYLHDKHYASAYSLLTTGDFFGARMVYYDIPGGLIPFDYDAFRESSITLVAVVTNCRTGLPEYKQAKDLRTDMDIIRASSSLPLLSRLVPIDGGVYLDGGIGDSIPLKRSMADGNRKNIVVLTQHRGYQKEKNSLYPVIRLKYAGYPNFVKSVKTRHLRYNAALHDVLEAERAGGAFVIQPRQPLNIGRLEKDKDKLWALYQQGYQDAEAQWPALEAFLG
ncbi:patatin family protein [Oscillospiraceae bacterium OttesenSCG-928-F05]|nr:patatin family protein [Oscillospiraceae bacterium OttesenSCG-928-F05]